MDQFKSKASLPTSTHLAEQSGVPPSPTTSTTSFMSSVSWMAEKSSSDLIPMLKNAYNALKDKERDLKLAAEIGKSLLENNIAMKNKYENLLNNTQSAPTATVLPTPSLSIATVSQRHGSVSGSEAYVENGGSDDEDDSKAMQFVSSQSTREAMIEILELKNTELNGQLETILEEQSHLDKSNNSKHRQLEQEVTALNDSLDLANNKIQELENMNAKAKLQRLNEDDAREQPTDDAVDQQLVEELLDQIDNLRTKNDTATQSKLDLESKLTLTLQDLRKLKQQFDHFQFTRDDHEDLKAAYERQFRHIDELTSSVEEHRAILQKLEDRGVSTHSTHSSHGETASSKPDGFRNTLLGELESEWLQQRRQHDHLHPSSSTPVCTSQSPCMKPSASTLSFNDLSRFTSESIASMYQQSESAMESVLARAAGVDQKTLEEAIRLVNHLEDGSGGAGSDDDDDCMAWLLRQNNKGTNSSSLGDDDDDDDDTNTERDPQLWTMFDAELPCDGLYPDASMRVPATENGLVVGDSNTFSGRIQSTVHLFFKAVWRWCRFAAILTTAVLINVWNGPDSMLLQN